MKKILTLLCCLMTVFTVSADNWTGTWATAPEWTGAGDMPKKTTLTGNSVRQIVHVSLGGQEIRVQLSNELSNEPVEIQSVYIADALDGKNINPKTVEYLKFDGKKNVTIEGGKAVFSDPLLLFIMERLLRMPLLIAALVLLLISWKENQILKKNLL